MRWCLQSPPFPFSPPKGVLQSYIYHLVCGGEQSWEKKALHAFNEKLSRSSKFKATTCPRNLCTRVTSIMLCCLDGSTLPPVCLKRLYLAFLGASYLPKSSLSQRATSFVYSILCSVADMLEGYDAFGSEEEGVCLVQ